MKQILPRRAFMKTGVGGIAALATGTVFGFAAAPLTEVSAQSSSQRGITLTKEWQEALTPAEIIALIKAGNERFVKGERIERDYMQDVRATEKGQHPGAVLLSCIDSRAPAEIIFDTGIGNIFNARIA